MRRGLLAAGAVAAAAATIVAGLPGASGATGHSQYRGVMLHSLWHDSPAINIERELTAARRVGANFGVLRRDFRPKPAFYGLQRAFVAAGR